MIQSMSAEIVLTQLTAPPPPPKKKKKKKYNQTLIVVNYREY